MSRRNSGAGATASPPSATTTLSSFPPTSFTFPNHHLPLHPHPVLLQHHQLNNSHTAAPTTSSIHPNHQHNNNNNNTAISAVRANRDTAAAAAVSAAIGVVLSPLPASSEPVARSPPRDLSAKGSSPASATLKVVADGPPTTRSRALTPALPPSPTGSSHSALLTTSLSSSSPPLLRSPSWQPPPSPSSSLSSSPSSRLVMVPSPAGSRRGSVVVPLEVALSLAGGQRQVSSVARWRVRCYCQLLTVKK